MLLSSYQIFSKSSEGKKYKNYIFNQQMYVWTTPVWQALWPYGAQQVLIKVAPNKNQTNSSISNFIDFRKAKLLERQAIKKSCSSQCLESLLQPDAKMNKSQQKFTYTKCILESVIVGEYHKLFQFLLYAPTLEHYYVVIQLADISNHQVKVWSLCLVWLLVRKLLKTLSFLNNHNWNLNGLPNAQFQEISEIADTDLNIDNWFVYICYQQQQHQIHIATDSQLDQVGLMQIS